MSHNYCGLTSEELESVRPDTSQLQAVRITHNTIIYVSKDRNPDDARKEFIKAWRRDAIKHIEDEERYYTL